MLSSLNVVLAFALILATARGQDVAEAPAANDPNPVPSTLGELFQQFAANATGRSTGVQPRQESAAGDSGFFVPHNLTLHGVDGDTSNYTIEIPGDICLTTVVGDLQDPVTGAVLVNATAGDIAVRVFQMDAAEQQALILQQAGNLTEEIDELLALAICDNPQDVCFYSDEQCSNGVGGRRRQVLNQFKLGSGWWSTLFLQTVPEGLAARFTYNYFLPTVNQTSSYADESNVLVGIAVFWIIAIAIVQNCKDNLGALEVTAMSGIVTGAAATANGVQGVGAVIATIFLVLGRATRNAVQAAFGATWRGATTCINTIGFQNLMNGFTTQDGTGLPVVNPYNPNPNPGTSAAQPMEVELTPIEIQGCPANPAGP